MLSLSIPDDSDHELDEYIPDISEDGESEVPITGEEGIGGGTMTERDAADSAMHSDEEEADEFAFASSRHSFGLFLLSSFV